jgi:hypothetical protein
MGLCGRVFIRVYRLLKIQSIMLVFSTQLCELLLLSPSLWFNSLPLHPNLVNKYFVYTFALCKGGGRWGGYGVLFWASDSKHLLESPFTSHFFRCRHCLL